MLINSGKVDSNGSFKIIPIAGMNNVSADDALQLGGDAPKLFVRDAMNVDISDTGRIALRKGASISL
jgi:hypothetical protein